ncbi:hypothetical protein PMAYCL1PPCAC_33026, partial [Pristionchus mayeri]
DWNSNPQDMDLLYNTWSDDFETLFTVGSRIYLSAFEGSDGAACKSLFPWIAKYEKEGRNYAEQNEFRIQALRLVQTISKVVDNISDTSKLEKMLYNVGKRHIEYLPRGLCPRYWHVMQ